MNEMNIVKFELDRKHVETVLEALEFTDLWNKQDARFRSVTKIIKSQMSV